MPFAHAGGADLWYELSGDGPTLVLTHGFAGPNWPPIIDEFRRRFRLLLYHARGHGRSSVPDDPATYSVPRFAADLRAVMDAAGIDRAHVGGVSMGGMISAQFACDYPERLRSVLLCDTTAGNGAGEGESADVERQVNEVFAVQTHIVEKYGLRGLIERENRYRREHDPYAAQRWESFEEQDVKAGRKLEEMTDRGYLLAQRALRERPDLTSRLPEVTAPALVSCGEWDAWHPCAVRDRGLLPNSRLATIRGAAHDSATYQPQLWLRAVSDFIDDVEAGRDVRGEVEYAAAAGAAAEQGAENREQSSRAAG